MRATRSEPLATYKDVCIDATDAVRSARFWALALDLRAENLDDGDAVLRFGDGRAAVWINTVPEPAAVKNRLHLDVNTEDVTGLLEAGATVVDDTSFRWTVLRDPDGQQFCAFVRPAPVANRWCELMWDCADSPAASHEIASWWAGVLGADLTDDERGFSYLERVPDCPFESFDFIPVPEAKTLKNRVHIDVWTQSVDALVDRGARVLRSRGGDIGWTVLADPDGNEFCAFVRE